MEIKKIYIPVLDNDDGWFRVGERFWGHKIDLISHIDLENEFHSDRLFMYEFTPDGAKLLRIFNYAHVICEDYV